MGDAMKYRIMFALLLVMPLPSCTTISAENLERLQAVSKVCEVLQNAAEQMRLQTSVEGEEFISVPVK